MMLVLFLLLADPPLTLDPEPKPGACRCLEWKCAAEGPCTCLHEVCPARGTK